MIKIEGLEKLTRELKAFEKAVASLDGELGTVNLDPSDPGSIERAIIEAEAMIDRKTADYPDNAMIAKLGESIKENLRQQIIEKATQARAEGGEAP